MLWLTAICFFFLRWITKKKIKKKQLWFVPYACLAIAVFSLAYAPQPFPWHTAAQGAGFCLDWLLSFPASWFDVTVALLADLLLLGIVIAAAFDLKDKKPEGIAKTMVYTAPVLATVASSVIATAVLRFSHTVSDLGPELIRAVHK